jgi:sterol 24-C-methyltransferase
VISYYNKTESRIGYDLFLRGGKHFGLYRPGDVPWNWQAAMRRMENKLAMELDLRPGARVLDAGCGVGEVSDHLAREYGLIVTGIDILDFNIQEAEKRAKRLGLEQKVSFKEMSYAELDFPDETFDGVFTMETLVHATDAEGVLQQFKRVLTKGGRLVLFEYSRTPERNMPKRAAQAFRQVKVVAAMPSFQRFDHGVLEELLENVGFTSVTVEDITTQMLPMLHCFELIARLPYAIALRLHREDELINAMSAVEFWRYREYFRYNIYNAIKSLVSGLSLSSRSEELARLQLDAGPLLYSAG